MSGYDALDELYEKLRDAEETQRAGGITPETIRAARGGAVDESGRTHATAAENAAGGDSVPLAGISRDTRERIEADAWEAARLDMSRTWEERRDAIVALLDRQAALTERECLELGAAVQNQRDKKFAELQAKVDELNAQNTRLNDGWAEANARAEKLQAELDELTADNDYLQNRMLGLEDSIISLEAERDELRAELDAHDETPDSWERICADLRAMDEGNLIALGNGQYVEDTRHDEIAVRIERMARA